MIQVSRKFQPITLTINSEEDLKHLTNVLKDYIVEQERKWHWPRYAAREGSTGHFVAAREGSTGHFVAALLHLLCK